MERRTMKLTVTWIMILGLTFLAVPVNAQDQAPLKNDKEKLSYALGMDFGNQLKKQTIEIDPSLFAKGLNDLLSGGKTLMTEEEGRTAVANLQAEMKRKAAEARKADGESNQKGGEAFLAQNKSREGVVTLPSGLQYKILKAGEGKKPVDGETVEVHYRGTLLDGKEFDSSYSRGQPTTFQINSVIPGWTEALKLMPVGSKWQLFIPPQLAYGERGAGANIGPNATLIFEVELLAIK
jgi:UDP-GlcNAc:undecaprenyl-phosphate/decaprenyl-phosphate GlcNAc-1-phosphate transferase